MRNRIAEEGKSKQSERSTRRSRKCCSIRTADERQAAKEDGGKEEGTECVGGRKRGDPELITS